MNISAAIDFSTANAALAVCETGSYDLIFTVHHPMRGRESSSLLPWIIKQLKEHGYSLQDVKEWSCGTGPGSFTGLRIVASLVAGLTYAKENIKVRGIPSGTAIAEKISKQTEKTAVLYDGRRREIICYTSSTCPEQNQKVSLPIIISSDNIGRLDTFENLCAMEPERESLKKILSEELFRKVTFLIKFPIEKLLLNKTYKWQKNSSGKSFFEPDLVYIRPAV